MLFLAVLRLQTAGAAILVVPTFSRISVPSFSSADYGTFEAAWGDADGDGRPDLYLSSLSPGSGQFFRNTTNGFVRVTEGPIFSDVVARGGSAWGDLDNDGDLDLFVPTLGGDSDTLYRNRGNGTFDKLTLPEPIQGIGHGSALIDDDNDGFLDVLVANGGGAAQQPIVHYRNLGGTLLTNLSATPLAGDARNFQGLALSDYDLDGDPDLIGASDGGACLFYENIDFQGFEARTNGVFGTSSLETFTATVAWGDYDNDGDADLLLVTGLGPIRLYRNDAGHRLQAVTNAPLTVGGPSFVGSSGGAWADFNNDGWLDVLITRRSGTPMLYLADGLGSFREPVDSPVLNQISGGNGLALADYDLDGDIDMLLPNWPQFAPPALVRNNVTNYHWLQVQLRGTLANRSGIGARVQVRATIAGQAVVQTREIGMFDSAGSQELLAHFGLGDAASADTIAVYWPNGDIQEVTNVSANQRLTITQDGQSSPIRFLPPATTFTNALEVTLRSAIFGTELRFTTDNSEPIATSPLYASSLRITKATTFKARLFLNGFPASEVVSATYLRVYAFDNDGIDPAWREKYFGPDFRTDPRAAAYADPDNDGALNRQEFTIASDPLDPASGFAVGVRAVPEISFPSVIGLTYRILRLDSVFGSNATVIGEITATSERSTYIDLDAGTKANPAYYLVEPKR